VAGLAGWFKADAIAGVADGAPVASWVDSSGRGHALSAPTGRQPLYRSNQVNGRPAVSFDGVDDLLQAYFPLNQPTTVFVVYRVRTDQGTQFVTDGFNNGAMADYVSGTQYGMYASGGTVLTKDGFTYAAFHVVGSVFNGVASALYAEGGPAVAGNSGSASPSGLTIGNSGAWGAPAAVDVAEVVLYDRALGPTDLDTVGNYLAAKYARTWAPAAGTTL
jgi:hypothetical protein